MIKMLPNLLLLQVHLSLGPSYQPTIYRYLTNFAASSALPLLKEASLVIQLRHFDLLPVDASLGSVLDHMYRQWALEQMEKCEAIITGC